MQCVRRDKLTPAVAVIMVALSCACVTAAESPALKESARSVSAEKSGIFVSHPHEGDEITADSTYIAGAVPPGSTITINGKPARINKQGFFCQVMPVPIGQTKFILVRNNNEQMSREIAVHRPPPPSPVPEAPLQILQSSIQPRADLGVSTGDLVEFAMRASPGGQAYVKLGGHVVTLQSGLKSGQVNRGLDTTYGVTYQQTSGTLDDLYTGFYKITPTDSFVNEKPVFHIEKAGTAVEAQSEARITCLAQPFLSTTAHDATIVRTSPDASRTTPWPKGVRVLVDGCDGQWWRCELTSGKHLWVDRSDLTGDEGPGALPNSRVRTINIENEHQGGARVSLPLTQRLPFEIKQEITPTNRLQLTVYGAVADTDWITEPSTSATADSPGKQGRAFPLAASRASNPVSFVSWQQTNDQAFRCTINLNTRQQWGYWAEYKDTRLILHVQAAPHLPPGSLKGLKVCLDPGHGGAETGAIGCSGVKEATINLLIAKELARVLTQRGADVTMTRTADVDVSLADRVKTAVQAHCALLVSVHCNSLPDGRNPWMEHGTSSYYYHPQSLQLAVDLRRGTLGKLKFADFHTRWQNLALCRPSEMPAALVEVGFMINPDEYASLITPEGERKAALGIAQGIETFVSESLWKTTRTKARRRS